MRQNIILLIIIIAVLCMITFAERSEAAGNTRFKTCNMRTALGQSRIICTNYHRHLGRKMEFDMIKMYCNIKNKTVPHTNRFDDMHVCIVRRGWIFDRSLTTFIPVTLKK